MKERIISICLLLLAAVTVWLISSDISKKHYARPASDFTNAVRNGTGAASSSSDSLTSTGSAVSPAVADDVIRLHILADSDTERDQAIKLALRDVLLPFLHAATLGAENKEAAMTQLMAQCPALTDIANRFLESQNAGYTATVHLEQVYFPIRIYGSQTYLSADAVIFPPGFYDSVQVVLGSGEGHNWWCLAYPSLCFIDSTYDYVPKNTGLYKIKIGTLPDSTLEELFYGESFREFPKPKAAITISDQPDTADSNDTTVFISFKFWELLKSLFQKKQK